MNFTDFRLKVRHFFRRNKRLLIIILIIWAIIFFLNIILGNMPKELVPETTYEAHTSIMDNSKSTPESLKKPIEDLIAEYVGYCNEGNYQKAFNMLSEDCRKYGFNDSVDNFMQHVLSKMPTPKKYSIQSYSNTKYGKHYLYIYQIKYIDDLLATGLTNSTYSYTEEDLTFYEGDNGLEMNAGNYIYHTDIKSISENEYLKIDVVDKVVNYSIETYEVQLTNRSNYTIVIQDGQEENEIVLRLPNEVRKCSQVDDVVLTPQESTTLKFTFPKFVDDGDESQALSFSSIRVMEQYSGVDNVEESIIQSEIDNAISKFSMEVNVIE